jgi:hypothetical protein
MRYETMFLIGAAVSLIIASLAVAYLRRPLHALLTDLCGTAERAQFWTAFSSVALLLLPLIFALDPPPDTSTRIPVVIVLAGQVKSALTGLGVTLVMLGIVIGRFIPRRLATVSGEKA